MQMQKRTIESIDPIGAAVFVAASRRAEVIGKVLTASVDRLECNQVREQINGTGNATGANEADEI